MNAIQRSEIPELLVRMENAAKVDLVRAMCGETYLGVLGPFRFLRVRSDGLVDLFWIHVEAGGKPVESWTLDEAVEKILRFTGDHHAVLLLTQAYRQQAA